MSEIVMHDVVNLFLHPTTGIGLLSSRPPNTSGNELVLRSFPRDGGSRYAIPVKTLNGWAAFSASGQTCHLTAS